MQCVLGRQHDTVPAPTGIKLHVYMECAALRQFLRWAGDPAMSGGRPVGACADRWPDCCLHAVKAAAEQLQDVLVADACDAAVLARTECLRMPRLWRVRAVCCGGYR